ncbi:MAG: hypothetical protein IKK04_04600 [Bacteroidales bacterium]|nr:hypothetical protein [Bacteroidales bacterium]
MEKMIRAGRYKVCFDGLESEVRADVQRRMETLLAEITPSPICHRPI